MCSRSRKKPSRGGWPTSRMGEGISHAAPRARPCPAWLQPISPRRAAPSAQQGEERPSHLLPHPGTIHGQVSACAVRTAHRQGPGMRTAGRDTGSHGQQNSVPPARRASVAVCVPHAHRGPQAKQQVSGTRSPDPYSFLSLDAGMVQGSGHRVTVSPAPRPLQGQGGQGGGGTARMSTGQVAGLCAHGVVSDQNGG